MEYLNFPSYKFRFKNSKNKLHIFDIVRKKFVALTPEEWVRQNVVHFLLEDRNYPIMLINVEKSLKINGLIKRYDVVVFRPNGEVFLVVECKAPHIEITQSAFDQIAIYNLSLNADFLMVTNGLNHYFCQMDYPNQCYIFLRELPKFC